MIYFDYAANTPTHQEVMEVFCEVNKSFVANANASHTLGKEAKSYGQQLTQKMADLLQVLPEQIIYTSGASEANNLAIKGIAKAYKRQGKHIITTYLEHASVINPIMSLKDEGYEVDFVDLIPNGTLDLEHLEMLLRPDTLMLCISAVDSELGIIQPLEEIKEVLTKKSHAFLHVDATQAMGKINLPYSIIDSMVFAPHKFYGLNGSGVLIKQKELALEPLIHGGSSLNAYRSGTPTLALNAASVKALELILPQIDGYFEKVKEYNKKIRDSLKAYDKVLINSPEHASPYILNISIKGILGSKFQEALSEQEVYVATKSACTQAKLPSRPVYAVTKDRKRALSTIRISLSHLTTEEEIERFIEIFSRCYKNHIQ